MFRPRNANVVLVACNDKETTLGLDYHADTSVLGIWAFVIADFNEPVNVQVYDPSLGSKTYQSICVAIGLLSPVLEGNFPPCDTTGYLYNHPWSPFVVSHEMSRGGCYY